MFDTWLKLNLHLFFTSWRVNSPSDGPTQSQISSVLIWSVRNVCINKCTTYFSFWSKYECRPKLYRYSKVLNRWYIGSSKSLIHRYRDQRWRPFIICDFCDRKYLFRVIKSVTFWSFHFKNVNTFRTYYISAKASPQKQVSCKWMWF